MSTSKRLSLYTFGVFIKPAEHEANDDWHKLNDRIFPIVDRASGLIARSGYVDEPGPPAWGEQVFPRFYQERGDGWSPATLSLWRDIESAMAFAYSGLHAEALKRGREWNVKPDWPPYVAWWVHVDHTPYWTEAVERHHRLHDLGSTSSAFNFKQPFDADGEPTTIDRKLIDCYVEKNASNSTPD